MYSIATQVLSETIEKIGYQVEFKDLPPFRSISVFNDVEADGYLFATDLFLINHPSAIKIEPALGYDEIMAFSTSSDYVINGWNSIRPYSIGLMNGMDVVENRTKGMRIYGTNSPNQAFAMLKAGRFDIVVLPRLIGCQLLSAYPSIQMLEPPLEKAPLYTFLNANHADIAPKLSKALSEMLSSGRLKAITEQVLTQELYECSKYRYSTD